MAAARLAVAVFPLTAALAAPLPAGDTVAVIGASGNVGKLLALRLADSFRVHAVVRRSSPAVTRFLQKDNIEIFEADLRGTTDALEKPLRDASAVVVCTGTTAFPTKAWSQSGDDEVGPAVLRALWESRFSVADAIATLDAAGYNTPRNVDDLGMEAVLASWAAAGSKRKRLVLMSSIGVDRRTEGPFPILNACGVLDAKAAAEAKLQADAKAAGYAYTVVRPGQLFGGPYDNNYYLGTLFQLDKDAAQQDVIVGKGDTLVGDTLRSTLAEVLAQLCETGAAENLDFCVVNQRGQPPTLEELRMRLLDLSDMPLAAQR